MTFVHEPDELRPGTLVPGCGGGRSLGILSNGNEDEGLVRERFIDCLPT